MAPWRFLLAALLATVLCACDGGSRGSGITTVQGDVEALQSASRALLDGPRTARHVRSTRPWSLEAEALAESGVGGVRVLVDGTGVAGVTDEMGAFRLSGRFEGDLTVRFELSDGSTAVLSVNAPAGGTLTLEGVQIDSANARATTRQQLVEFDGLVTKADCPNARIELVSVHRAPGDTDVYEVQLSDSSIRDGHGATVSCLDVRVGESTHVQGVVEPDGTFGRAEIDVE